MRIDSATLRDFSRSSKLEWLETNGTGAFAMGTVAQVNTRRYHALLVASLRPPVERYVLLSRVEEEAVIGTADRMRWGSASIRESRLEGCEWLEEFRPIRARRGFSDHRRRTAAARKTGLPDRGRQGVVIRYRADRAVELAGAAVPGLSRLSFAGPRASRTCLGVSAANRISS